MLFNWQKNGCSSQENDIIIPALFNRSFAIVQRFLVKHIWNGHTWMNGHIDIHIIYGYNQHPNWAVKTHRQLGISSQSRFRAGVQPQEEPECHPKPCGITWRITRTGVSLNMEISHPTKSATVKALFSKFTLCVTGLSNHWKVFFAQTKYKQNQWSKIIQA